MKKDPTGLTVPLIGYTQRVIRTCKYSWLFPLTGFVLTFVGGLGFSLSNQDIRVDVQRIGLVVFAVLTVVGFYYTFQAFRYFKIYRIKACFYHAVGGLLFNLFLLLITAIRIGAFYIFNRHSGPLTIHPVEAFKPLISYPSRLPIWIDTDPASGEGETDDVDDCWALIAALRSPELDIRGISTV